MVSNHLSQKFTLMAQHKAIIGKLIILKYTLSSQILPELQISQLKSYLDPYLVDILNWAVYIPNTDY